MTVLMDLSLHECVEDDVPYAHVIQRHVYILDGLIDRGPLSLVLYTQVLTGYGPLDLIFFPLSLSPSSCIVAFQSP